MEFYLRKATEKDIDILFQWANDPIVRKNSFATERISYQEHCKWFQKILEQADCQQYIYVFDNENVGQVRISINGNTAKISYSVCREKRCMGHGKRMLQLLTSQVESEFPFIEKLIAEVKADNVSSRQVFLETGYTESFSCYELNMKEMRSSECQDIENIVPGGGIIPDK